MASNSKIEWTETTWSPVTGCTKISDGCKNCYAERMSKRLKGMGQAKYKNGFAVTTHEKCLSEPLHWKKPRRIFVCSMGDLFHEDVPFEFIHQVWDIMKRCPQHTFIVLTKRPERMGEVISRIYSLERLGWAKGFWEHIWLGVTAENQRQYDRRMTLLADIPAAVRFVSFEPLLGPIEPDIDIGYGVGDLALDRLDWAIIGCESGPKRRLIDRSHLMRLFTQLTTAGVPLFVKQWHVDGAVVKMPRVNGVVWNQYPDVTKKVG